ncbi:sigma-70 family RNA polymerase sigma factor [Arachidicoccus terrestris]|uniref:sigma-70 family RNA polymerase sigma factor n=1 Tax=Arachidicoccus terrestris TaxID=2875539 RepID=UPI001CC61BB5|nr:sigma-70 family RNA polymerase sigma factor [Arachidicoccus terrestris]UAY55070.1 sigma-70 family RNA polymerase sigma factor [Arachidicoccus terrestris]
MADTRSYADQEIIERILQGEKALFEIIVRRFNAALYKVGRTYNYGLEDTKDLMQETFISAYKNLSKFEQRSSFKTWIIRIMLNNCYRKKNKLSFIKECELDLDHNSASMLKDTNNDTNAFIQQRELGHIIEAALLKIPYDYRMVFSLREINGLNVLETAHLLNISESNVKVRLNRAKAMLRKEISKVYAADELFEFNLIHCDEIVDVVMDCVNRL